MYQESNEVNQYDEIVELKNGTVIQHGPYNDRIYLMKIGGEDISALPTNLISMAREHSYSKIFAKIPSTAAQNFLQEGFITEATVPNFYNGVESAEFVSYFLDEKRSFEIEANSFENILELAISKSDSVMTSLNTSLFEVCKCLEIDVLSMAQIYKTVFPTYPFPIADPNYLLETMRSHIDYFCIKREGKIVALSSSEMDKSSASTEMTDFATLPRWRGNGFSTHLLNRMEQEAKEKEIKTAYTIARSISPGMNITFSKLGYFFAGRLKNNTNISGCIESMNVWYKKLLN